MINLDPFIDWLISNYQWLVALLVQGFIAYHVFFLSKKISVRDRLLHRERIKNILDGHLAHIHRHKANCEMALLNSAQFSGNDNKDERFKCEIKSTCKDGVEFFEFIQLFYRTPDGKLHKSKQEGAQEEKIWPVVLLPYEAIEHVDLSGDEVDWLPQIICKFKGIKGTPWTELRYYRENSTYHEGNDPPDFRFLSLRETIYP